MPMISFFRDADDKTKGSLERLVNIWKERGVFDKEVIYAIKDKLKGEFSDKTVFTICISPKKLFAFCNCQKKERNWVGRHGLSQQGLWVSFWTPKPLKSAPQDTQIFL